MGVEYLAEQITDHLLEDVPEVLEHAEDKQKRREAIFDAILFVLDEHLITGPP